MANNKLEDFLANISSDDLQYYLNRYCGRGNVLLFENTFRDFTQKQFEKAVRERIAYNLFDQVFTE